eukprot:SAG11_NODE_1577_length_4652_cov_12.631013_2_plen_53_part_00
MHATRADTQISLLLTPFILVLLLLLLVLLPQQQQQPGAHSLVHALLLALRLP